MRSSRLYSLRQQFLWKTVEIQNGEKRRRLIDESLWYHGRLGRCENRAGWISMWHPSRWNVLFRSTGDAGVNTVSPFHVFIVIRPISEVMLAIVARIWTFACN